MGRNKARASKRLVCERRRVNSAELHRCCLAGSSESVKTPAPSLISIGLCHRSERKARLLPSLASDSHLATYFKPLFSHHRKATKQMVFTSKAVLPQGRGLGSYEAERREKEVGYELEFETHHEAAVNSPPLLVSGCHLSSAHMTNG